MIERGSGRTSGLTDWQLMDVLSMWACLQDHDTKGHWKQVSGWRKVCDLALTHLGRLQEYRRGLAEAWPETNAAAKAYLGELDTLIDKVQRTHDAAAANHDALAAATRALDSSRPELKRLYEEYASKLQQKRSYEATIADPKAVAGSRVVDPPVTDAELEQLNVRARVIMFGLSGELQQAQVMLRQPPPRPTAGRQSEERELYGTASAPIIPPIVPVPLATGDASPALGKAPSPVRQVPTASAPTVGPVLGAGPILGGASSGLAPNPVNLGLPSGTPTVPPTPSTSAGIGLPPTLPPASGRGNNAGPLRGPAGQLGRPTVGNGNDTPHASPPPRSMPPGGMIGGTPGTAFGQSGLGSTAPRRVNPVGGVIGGGGAGTAPTGAAGSRPGAGRVGPFGGANSVPPIGGAPGMGGTSARPGRRERGDRDSARWDPDHPWETDEGVDPVVRPPDDEGPIDPGPAIGFTR